MEFLESDNVGDAYKTWEDNRIRFQTKTTSELLFVENPYLTLSVKKKAVISKQAGSFE